MSKKQHRDAGSGEYVSPEYAEANPDTTVSETQREAVPEAFWRTQALWCDNRIDWAKERIEAAKAEIAEMKRMKEFCEGQIKRVK